MVFRKVFNTAKDSTMYYEKELRKLRLRDALTTDEVKRAEIRRKIKGCEGILRTLRKMDAPINRSGCGEWSARGAST